MCHEVQEKGRFEVFEDYHLRVSEITADSQVSEERVLNAQRLDETEIGQAKVATISELSPVADGKSASADLAADLGLPRAGTLGVIDEELFESIYNPGKLLLLVSWKDAATADRWQPKAAASGKLRHRHVRIIRDYGMTDRREAPQYYPPVQSGSRR